MFRSTFLVKLISMHIKMYPTSRLLEPTSRHFASHKQESHEAYKFKCQPNPSKRLLRGIIFTDLTELYASHPPLRKPSNPSPPQVRLAKEICASKVF